MEDDDLSEAFVAFARSVLGGVTRRADLEDYDLASLAQLKGAEREAAEMLLVEQLDARVDDPRAPRALVHIGTPSAYDAMRTALPTYRPGYTAVALAKALWRHERSDIAIEALLATLGNALFPAARAAAADALSSVPGARIDRALVAAMRDGGSVLSRQAATLALLKRRGIDEPSLRADPQLADILDDLRTGSAATVDAALEELGEVAARLRTPGR